LAFYSLWRWRLLIGAKVSWTGRMARVSESGHGVLPPPLPEQLSGHNLYPTSRRLRGLVRVRTRPPAGSDRVRSIRVSASFHRVLSILAKGAYDLGGRFTSYCLPQFSGRRRALGTKKATSDYGKIAVTRSAPCFSDVMRTDGRILLYSFQNSVV